ncbi:Hypothetical protein KVN_LOCUS124 [uncultured virus]|nr:Hypothetical protein KVN_LOCUS124 [uncultured virus]
MISFKSIYNDLLLHIFTFLSLHDIAKYKIYLVDKQWLNILGNANQLVNLFPISFHNTNYFLKITKFVPTIDTVKKFTFLYKNKDRTIQLYLDSYHYKLWKNIKTPTIEQFLNDKNFSFNDICNLGNKNMFTHFIKRMERFKQLSCKYGFIYFKK